jgi:hypothetical protein
MVNQAENSLKLARSGKRKICRNANEQGRIGTVQSDRAGRSTGKWHAAEWPSRLRDTRPQFNDQPPANPYGGKLPAIAPDTELRQGLRNENGSPAVPGAEPSDSPKKFDVNVILRTFRLGLVWLRRHRAGRVAFCH